MRPITRSWTDVEIGELRRLWLSPTTIPQIARRLKRGTGSVELKARMVGLPTKTEVSRGFKTSGTSRSEKTA